MTPDTHDEIIGVEHYLLVRIHAVWQRESLYRHKVSLQQNQYVFRGGKKEKKEEKKQEKKGKKNSPCNINMAIVTA